MDLESSLLEKLTESPSIRELLDFGAQYFGNPLSLYDSAFRMHSYSATPQTRYEELLSSAREAVYISDVILEDMNQNHTFQALNEGTTDISDLPNEKHAMRCPLFSGGQFLGFIGMYDYNHPFRDSDTGDLETFRKAMYIVLRYENPLISSGTDAYVSYFQQLLQTNSINEAQIIREKNSRLSFRPEKYLIVFQRDPDCIYPKKRVAAMLDKNPLRHYTVIDGNFISVLVEKDRNKELDAIGLRTIHSFCEENHLQAVISYEFTEDTYIPAAYRACLQLLFHFPSGKRLVHFSDYMTDVLLKSASAQNPPAMFIRPEIRRIMAYDEAYGTEYLKTLFTYLENLGSMKKASELLQIHYNTMKYRIQQIESICGTEFHDRPDILVQLYLSMKLQDMQ